MDFAQKYEFINGAGGSGITIRRHVYDASQGGRVHVVRGGMLRRKM
jgi:hypothetical protein